MKFWMLWGFDALVALIFVYFFLVGIADGSVSSFNITLWTGILGFLAVVLTVPVLLKRSGHAIIAVCALLVLAAPAFLSLVLLILLVLTHPRWN